MPEEIRPVMRIAVYFSQSESLGIVELPEGTPEERHARRLLENDDLDALESYVIESAWKFVKVEYSVDVLLKRQE